MVSAISGSTLLIDFSEDDWATKFPEIISLDETTYPWFISDTYMYDDKATLRSYAITHSQTSSMKMSFTLLSSGSIELGYICSSEANFDFLYILIDNSQYVKKSGLSSGDWTTLKVELAEGTHTLEVKYTKDGSSSKGLDAAAINYIKIVGVKQPFAKKYLLKSGDKVYTVSDGSIVELSETSVNAELFRSQGFDEVPTSDILLSFSNGVDILYWQDDEESLPKIKATLDIVPFHQSIISNLVSLEDETIKGIEKVTATCSDEISIAFSFDGQQTWKAWNGSEWGTLSEDDTGMNKSTLELITLEQWNELYSGATGFYIRIILADTIQYVKQIYVDFLN